MNTSPHATQSAPTEPPAGALRRWLNPRTVRFWAVLVLVLYTLCGFFLAPVLVKKFAVEGVRESSGRDLAIGAVRINPFVLSAEAENLALLDTDGETLLSLDLLRANFQLSSLFRWAWTFREIRLDAPYVLYERFTPDADRFTRLLADIERLAAGPAPAVADPAGLPRLLIEDLQLNAGRAALRDHVPAAVVVLDIGPVTVDIRQLNTLPDRDGRQAVDVRFPGGAAAVWQGSLSLAPLASEGRLTLENLALDPLRHYLDGVIDLASLSARLSVRTTYRIEQRDDGVIALALTGLETDLEDFAVSGFEPAEPILGFDALRTRGGALAWPEARLDAGQVTLTGLAAGLQLDGNGEPRILQLLPPAADVASATPPNDEEAMAPWLLAASGLRVEQARFEFEDRSIEPAANVAVAAIDVDLSNVDNQVGTRMPLTVAAQLEGGGTARLEGDLIALPAVLFDGRAGLAELPVALAQPYLQQAVAVRVADGALRADFGVSLAADGQVRANGAAGIDGLLLTDTATDQPLLGWKQLDIDRFQADTSARRFAVSRIDFQEPYGRLEVREDRSTNLSELVVTTGDPAVDARPAPAGPDAEPWAIEIARIDFADGAMDFSDRSLPLPFAVRIGELGGTVTGIASASAEAASMRLEGKVGDYGLARINGDIRPLDPLTETDIEMEFRNLLMSDLSPYSIEFAGRRIDEGKLNLELEYRIENERLAGENAIVISDLVLGEKVDSPNAVNLPLDLAVALLRDADGVIDIDLPVEGNVGDPEFRIGGVVWKAFTSLITKIVTAPFALLGNLVGSDADDFGRFEFLAGRADLTPPELEKIAKLTEALQQRPQIALDIKGVYDKATDTPMLQYLKLREQVYERLGRGPAERSVDEGEMLAENVRGVLEDLFRARFPDIDLETIRTQHTRAAGPDAKPELDGLAYAADLRDRLLVSEEIGPQELQALAAARAAAVRNAFLESGQVAEDRLRLEESEAVESADGEWVVMELGVDIP